MVECTGLENRKGRKAFEGSNPSLSASRSGAAHRAPVAQWIERQVADLKVVSSSLAGRAIFLPRAEPPRSARRPRALLRFSS